MALVSMDSDVEPLYWGGREGLVGALGRKLAPEPEKSDDSPRAKEFRKSRTADFQAVKVSIKELVDKGVVAVDNSARPGQNAVYRLILGDRRGRPSLPDGVGNPGEWGRPSLPNGVGPAYPQGTKATPTGLQEPLRNINPGTKSPLTLVSPGGIPGYPQARDFLASLPDLGAKYMNRVPIEITGLKERVIAAAEIARMEEAS